MTTARVTVRRASYAIVGSTLPVLRSMMHRLGPRRQGRRYAAFTDWSISIRRAPQALVELEATLTLPRWVRPAAASPDVVAAWEAFLSALTAHEEEHLGIASEAARDLARMVRDDPHAPDCALRQTVAHARAREQAFDARTRHGRTQGVVLFPAPAGESR